MKLGERLRMTDEDIDIWLDLLMRRARRTGSFAFVENALTADYKDYHLLLFFEMNPGYFRERT